MSWRRDWLENLRTAFTYLGSAGGLLYVVDLIRRRPKVRVRILEESSGSGPPKIVFELENVGLTATSLKPDISMRGILPRPSQSRDRPRRIPKFKSEIYRLYFKIDSPNRLLPYLAERGRFFLTGNVTVTDIDVRLDR